MGRLIWVTPIVSALLSMGVAGRLRAEQIRLGVPFAPGKEASWRFLTGEWRMEGGTLEQRKPDAGSSAILLEPVLSDFVLKADFRISSEGAGVRAAALILRAVGTMSYYWVHLDNRNQQVILVRCTPESSWVEIARKPFAFADDEWHTAEADCRGPRITIRIDGQEALTAEDGTLAAGRVGLGTSQGHVIYRNLTVEGEAPAMSEPLREEKPLHLVISRGEAAGLYQAFPDACRLANGDILCVFYAGYGHVSLPNEQWPRGGRVCMVRSSDEGRTWSEPQVLYDDGDDNRDPHIAQMSDGTLFCSFFSLVPRTEANWGLVGPQVVRSTDGGRTWEDTASVLATGWACSAPVREMPDGTYILGVYSEDGKAAWGGVVRSTDGGETWSAPIPIGEGSGMYLDAETDVIPLPDGTLFAALRSSKVDMHYATSPDLGLTWSPVRDIGFPGHCPHLIRLKGGEIILTHRVPATSLHVSRDDARTWQGPLIVDEVGGAYPATVELDDGTLLVIYYEEGEGSAIRARRFRLTAEGLKALALE